MTHQVGHMPNENASMKELVEYQKNLKSFIDKNQGLSVSSDDTDSFIKKQNEIGVSGGISQLNSNLGALAPFINQASGILDNIYGKTVEPTQREKDLNMGRAALKFFTQLGAASSVPGQTALGAANIAGASVAQDYLNKVQSDKDKADKLEQAKKAGSISLGMQLKSAKEAKELAKLKIKPDYINIYKTDKNGLGEKVLNVIKGSADYIKKTSPGGGYITDKPPAEKAPTVYEDDFGEKRYLNGPNEGKLVKEVTNANKIENNENVDTESEDDQGDIVSENPVLIKLTKTQHSQAKDFRKTINDTTKDFRTDIQTGYLKIMQFYNNRDPIGDYSLAVGYAKMIDPGSVAREGEVNAVANSGSIPDTLKAQLLNAITGNGRLPERVRAGIYNRAIEIFNTERLKALQIIDSTNKSWSAQLGRNDQLGHILHYKVEPAADEKKKIDLSKLLEEKDFVFNEEAIKGMNVQQLRDIIAFQNLTNEQIKFVGDLVKEKIKG